MRKLSYIFLVLSGLCLMTSCIEKIGPMGPMGPQGPAGRDGKDAFEAIKIVYLNVDQAAWKYSGMFDNNYFVAQVKVPELTEDIFDGGIIKMYRTYDYDTRDAIQIEMPYVRPREFYEEGNPEPFRYTEVVDYDFGIGYINIYFTVSDFYYEVKPEAMTFRCVLMY